MCEPRTVKRKTVDCCDSQGYACHRRTRRQIVLYLAINRPERARVVTRPQRSAGEAETDSFVEKPIRRRPTGWSIVSVKVDQHLIPYGASIARDSGFTSKGIEERLSKSKPTIVCDRAGKGEVKVERRSNPRTTSQTPEEVKKLCQRGESYTLESRASDVPTMLMISVDLTAASYPNTTTKAT